MPVLVSHASPAPGNDPVPAVLTLPASGAVARAQGDAVVELAVLYDDETPAHGFRKLPHDLSKGGEHPVYVAFRTAGSAGAGGSDSAGGTSGGDDTSAGDGEDTPAAADDATEPAGGTAGSGKGAAGDKAEGAAAGPGDDVLQPITELTVTYSADVVPGDGEWERVARPLSRGGSTEPVLWFKRREVSGACRVVAVLRMCDVRADGFGEHGVA